MDAACPKERRSNSSVKFCRKQEKDAVGVIERSWCSYRDSQMYKLLKYAICAAVSGH